MIAICSKCGRAKKTYSSFGKQICEDCLRERKTRDGHSGMIYRKVCPEEYSDILGDNRGLYLLPVPKSHPLFVMWYFDHYPESKGIVGRQLNYLIYISGKPVGIIGFASPPLNYRKFNEFFQFQDNDHSENSTKILNNNVFRIIYPEKNLGTKILKVARNLVRRDYRYKYGDELVGLVTFVEKPRTGAVYKADNWNCLGETQGITVRRRGSDWTNKQYGKGKTKHIFAYKFKETR